MFRWCAYCQTFLGEAEPREDFSLTHGICISCKSQPRTNREALAEAARPMLEFFEQMRTELLNEKNQDPVSILESARKIGIAPVDLIAGLMQPLLVEIACLQGEGRATIRQEHEFSMLLEGILHEVNRAKTVNKPKVTSGDADVLLSCCDGNYHVFGIRIINEFLTKEGMNSKCIFPGYPLKEIIRTAQDIKASVIGISVFTQEQTEQVIAEWSEHLKKQSIPSNLSVVIGGFGAATTQSLPPGLYIHNGSLAALKAQIENLILQAKTPLPIAK